MSASIDQSNQTISPQQKSASLHLARSGNLPQPLTSLIGREQTIVKIRNFLTNNRLITLTGPGGIGKTRLSLEVARATLADYEDGVWQIELAPLQEPELVAQMAMQLFALPDRQGQTKLTTLGNFLQPKQLLLVLDNCEHLIAACAELSQHLLQVCPWLRIMATSRERLAVPGEVIWQVSPLSLPSAGQPLTPETLPQFEATRLFVERARTVQPNFEVSPATTPPIAQICRQLDGIPLAIELAAARLRVLTVSQIADRLDDRFYLLTGGSRTALPRHQTLRAAIEWSYNLLTGPEQRLFSRLAIFSGRFTLEAVEKVAADPPDQEDGLVSKQILDLLAQLVDKSLVVASSKQQTRYSMLDTIRHYAWEQLQASGELEQLCQQHLVYYLELSEQIKAIGISHPFEADYDNFRAALAYALENSQNTETGLKLAGNLDWFWIQRGYASEGIKWLTNLLNRWPTTGSVSSVRANTLAAIAMISQAYGDIEQAIDYTKQSLDLYRQLEDRQGVAGMLTQLGSITYRQGDYDQGRRWLEESLSLFQDLGDEISGNQTWLYLGDLLLRQGHYEQATVLFQKSLTLSQKLGMNWGMAWAYGGLGDIARLQGDYEKAARLLQQALTYEWEITNNPGLPFLLEGIANLAVQQELFELAAQLWGAAEALREENHYPLPPVYQADYAPYMTATRQALGDSAFAAAWTKGRVMPLADAVTLALKPFPAKPSPSAASKKAPSFNLTPRELEVLRLVATGLTDPQIAEELVISPRTVSKHLQSIYGKLLVSTRSAATRFAVENGLV